jgi:hypothetical protein
MISRREGILKAMAALSFSGVAIPKTWLTGESPILVSPNDVVGAWHYRSFLNNSQKVSDLNTILFGEGEFAFDETATGQLTGTGDFGGGDTVKFQGTAVHGSLLTLRFQGTGTGAKNSDWVYDYLGVMLPQWPNGVSEVRTIVGTVVRSAPHGNGSGGVAPAGRVASFVAVKR